MSNTESPDVRGGPGVPTNATSEGESAAGAVVVGLMIMGIGLLLLMSRLEVIDFHVSARHMWPFIVLAFGLARMAAPRERAGRPRSRRSGAWLVFIGVWGIVTEFHVLGLDYDTSWPLFIVAVGVGTIWRAFETQDRPIRQSPDGVDDGDR